MIESASLASGKLGGFRPMAQPVSCRRLSTSRSSLALPSLAGALLLTALAAPRPAAAIDTLELRLFDLTFTVKVEELANPETLLRGKSDLADLDRAVHGALGKRLGELFLTPLPVQTTSMVRQSIGTPLVEQALLTASSLTSVDGKPPRLITNDPVLEQALRRAAQKNNLNLLSLMRALPGRTASIDLERGINGLRRVQNQQRHGLEIVSSRPAVASSAALSQPGTFPTQRLEVGLAVSHRPKPLTVVVIRPVQAGNGHLVVISHGLWDGPESFEGWAQHLASHGYTVVLPVHPGSDSNQQRAMLSGEVPPPGPAELRLRPLDVTAVLNGIAAGAVPALGPVATDRVVVIGHSWGATTALQLAGARPSSGRLMQRCTNVADPDRNLSWVLQCSFLDSADQAALADRRVIAVGAVSPPLNLLFDFGSAEGMQARALLVTGSRDWVVTSGPEAIDRFGPVSPLGHKLVVANGGDHFNLRGPTATAGGPLRALLLAWTDGAFAAGAAIRPMPGAPALLPPTGWGDTSIPLVDGTSRSAP